MWVQYLPFPIVYLSQSKCTKKLSKKVMLKKQMMENVQNKMEMYDFYKRIKERKKKSIF